MECDAYVAQLPRIYRVLRQRARRAGCVDVEDIVQEAVVATWRKISTLWGDDALPYACGVLSHLIGQVRRQAKRAPVQLGEEAMKEQADGAPGALPQETHIQMRELGESIERLDPEHQAIVLADLKGDSQAEIADAHNLPRGTVKSRLHRVTAVLRADLEGVERPRRPLTKERARRRALRRPADGASSAAKVPPSGEGDIPEAALNKPNRLLWQKLRRWLRLAESLPAPACRELPPSDRSAV
jgi:RNA polymerase sigma-70 factor (ECF subfamily)